MKQPVVSAVVRAMGGSVYSHLAARLSEHQGPTYPLHIGDTWMDPAKGSRMEDLRAADLPGLHRYTGVQGLPQLIEAVAARVSREMGLVATPAEVQISAGATGGLCAIVGAIVDPGDEVIILAPYWPLIGGMVRSFRGKPVVVPFMGEADSPESAAKILAGAVTARTKAVYWNTPNNPTGRRIPESWLVAMVEVAREHGLWILADEVYESYAYIGEHTHTRPLAPERTLSLHSFSKAYGMAGNRVGYVIGPADALAQVRKISTHTFYSTPTSGQWAALAVLGAEGDAWVARARERYAELGNWAADRLGVDRPEGSTFLFLDVADSLDEGGLPALLERAVQRGLLVAPGPTFGPYPTHVRVCFTSAEPERVRAGVEILANLL